MTDELEIVRTILKSARTASVTTQTASGALHSRPLAVLEDDFAGTLWFFTADPSSKTADLAAHPQVNVSVGDGKGWLSLSGLATISRDQERIDRYWNPWAAAYFEGTAFEVAKGLLTRPAPDVGDDGVIQLH